MKYDGVKVFSATKARDRENLGNRLTEWLDSNNGINVVNTVVTQSSDKEFHCLSITVFFQSQQLADQAQAVAV